MLKLASLLPLIVALVSFVAGCEAWTEPRALRISIQPNESNYSEAGKVNFLITIENQSESSICFLAPDLGDSQIYLYSSSRKLQLIGPEEQPGVSDDPTQDFSIKAGRWREITSMERIQFNVSVYENFKAKYYDEVFSYTGDYKSGDLLVAQAYTFLGLCQDGVLLSPLETLKERPILSNFTEIFAFVD
jgi:hypothetical protein